MYKDLEKKKLYFREYRKRHHEKMVLAERGYRAKPEAKEKRKKNSLVYQRENRERMMSYKLKFPEKEKARNKLRYEIKMGRIVKKKCQECGSLPTDGHHKDYLKPLEVVWLCRKHHIFLHKAIKEFPKS